MSSSDKLTMLQKMVGLYYTNWSIYSKNPHSNNIAPSSLDLEGITHIFYAFFTLDEKTGAVISGDAYADFEMERKFQFKGKDYKVKGLLEEFNTCRDAMEESKKFKMIMSVGGWGRCELFASMAKSETKIKEFVDSSIKVMSKYGFDGIDIDWEFPENREEGDKLAHILSVLRKATDEYGDKFTISIASPAGWPQVSLLNLNEMNKYLHFWNVMTYDYTGEWEEKIGYNCNLYSVKGAPGISADDKIGAISGNLVMEYYHKCGIDRSKLMFGMPNYGRMFWGTKGHGHTHAHLTYEEYPGGIIKLSLIPPMEMELHYSKELGTSYCYNEKEGIFITYDDMNVLKDKIQYIKDQKLGGGFFWDAESDFPHNDERSHLAYLAKNLN